MTAKMKRFYTTVEVAAIQQDGEQLFQILLDGRVLKTPEKQQLLVANQKLAEAIAQEWEAVSDEILPAQMPLFSSATTVIDRVMPQSTALREQLVEYLENELICFRAPQEEAALFAFQQAQWDEWLAWMKDDFGIVLSSQSGIMPIIQTHIDHQHVMGLIAQWDDWTLSCLVRMTQLSGSFVLSWAFVHGKINIDRVFELSFLEELFQNERWGQDEDAIQRQQHIKSELADIGVFYDMLQAT